MKRCHLKTPWPCKRHPDCEGCQYYHIDTVRMGGYMIVTEPEMVPYVKEQLLEQIIHSISELAKRDDFWIMKPVRHEPTTIGYVFEIPHMEVPEEWREQNERTGIV